MTSSTIRAFTCLIILTAVLLLFGCRDTEPEQQTALTAEMPLHLEEHLDTANIEGSEVPGDIPKAVEWRFDEPQPDWKVVDPCKFNVNSKPAEVVRTEDALRIVLTQSNAFTRPDGKNTPRRGSVYIDLPDWQYEEWAYVVVRARASRGIGSLGIAFNLPERPAKPDDDSPEDTREVHIAHGESVSPVGDGSMHTYVLRTDWLPWGQWKGGPWRQLRLMVSGPFDHPEEKKPDTPATLDILSVSVIPKAAVYADAAVGIRTEVRGQAYRRSLYAHTPARLEYRVRLPEAARLDVGLGVLREDVPVTFRVIARSGSGTVETLFEETYTDKLHWAQRSVDLSRLAGQTVNLTLEAVADRPGTIALWAAPTLSGSHRRQKPNVILYIIDCATAEHMSLYGYNRRTTPNIERIAAEGAVFEDAYSNSSWSKTSVPSFMTSLHHSMLGGYWTETDPLPDEAVTMAQLMHRAGYQTAVFTTNAYCGIMSSLEREVDVLREAGFKPNSASSRELHEDFWAWRKAYPGGPYWVHVQTLDLHPPWKPQPPMAGLFITPERRKKYEEWVRLLGRRPSRIGPDRFKELDISRTDFFDVLRGLYDETLAYQDYQLGRLVERLKSTGEWEHTLFIIAADHGWGGLSGVLGAGVSSESPRQVASHTSFAYHIPLIIVWPERIAPGQRFSEPVSMIDMLPTILDLTGLPMPDVMQGQSLVPLLLGREGWEPRPVIIDEFYGNKNTGELSGSIAMIDSRWIAWGQIPMKSEDTPEGKKAMPLQLFDRWKDPFTAGSVHEERPDLAEKYIRLIKAQWETHKTLAQQFKRSKASPLTPEQIWTLRSLGYIQ